MHHEPPEEVRNAVHQRICQRDQWRYLLVENPQNSKDFQYWAPPSDGCSQSNGSCWFRAQPPWTRFLITRWSKMINSRSLGCWSRTFANVINSDGLVDYWVANSHWSMYIHGRTSRNTETTWWENIGVLSSRYPVLCKHCQIGLGCSDIRYDLRPLSMTFCSAGIWSADHVEIERHL